MGLLSATTSLTRYMVDGTIDDPILENIAAGLKKHTIADIDENPSEQAVGWVNLEDPFKPSFEESGFMMGTSIVFALRIDKKSIPSKMVQKHVSIESERRLKELGREFLSADEKRAVKDSVINRLNLKMPSTPNIYDVIWHYEDAELWFFSNLKKANEELETLFIKSFGMTLVRAIPYTMAALDKNMTADQLDRLSRLSAGQQTRE